MAVPGFSVNDLIQVAGKVKLVYDAFFNKYTNSASQVRCLAEDIEQFRINLKNNKDIIEKRHGLEYPNYAAIQRTLDECTAFLESYGVVLEKKFSTEKAWKIALYPFEQGDVTRLRNQIAIHGNNIRDFSMNVILYSIPRRDDTITTSAVSQAQPIPTGQGISVTPPSSPPLLSESPRFTQASSPSSSPIALSAFAHPSPPLTRPQQEPDSRQQDFDLSPIIPQPALPYCVAQVYFGSKFIELKRKPTGRDFADGRDLIIVDEKGNPRLIHRIKVTQKQSCCYPYTWHRKWKDHELEVTFKGPATESHSIIFKGQPGPPGTPRYKFSRRKDFMEFQSQVRGKDLLDYFDFRQIRAASSSKNGEATYQHVKMWRDRNTQEHSISFYASAVEKPGDVEFPISMFNQEISPKDGLEVELDFSVAKESKRKFSKAFSRSPTERTDSSTATSFVPSLFSRQQTGFTNITSYSAASTASRMSVASLSSDSSQTQTERPRTSASGLEPQAKKMKYLQIEFSDAEEATRFRRVYGAAYNEESSRPLDFLLSWQLDAGTSQGPGSIASNSSAPGTPFAMSPVLRAQRSPRIP